MSEADRLGVVRLIKQHATAELDIEPDRTYVGMIPPANVSVRSYTAQSKSNAQISFSEQTPNVRVGLCRTIPVELDVILSIDPRDLGGAQVRDVNSAFKSNAQLKSGAMGNIGLRAWPLASVTDNANARLNDQSYIFDSPARTVHALMTYGNDWKDRQYHMGKATAHKPDYSWRYTGAQDSLRSALIDLSRSPYEESRTFAPHFVERIDDYKIRLRIIEPMMLSPFTWTGERKQALFGIQNVDINLSLRQPLERMLSGECFSLMEDPLASGVITCNPRIDIDGAKIHLCYQQPQAFQTVPASLNYEHYNINRYLTRVTGTKSPGSSITVNYSNIQLNVVPARIYLYLKPVLSSIVTGRQVNAADSFDAISQADHFAKIKQLKINFDAKDGIFSTYDDYDLYCMSVNNGYNRTWHEWDKTQGAVVCVDFKNGDIGISPLLASGVRGSFQFSAEVNWQDVRDAELNFTGVGSDIQTGPIEYEAHMLVVNEGIVNIHHQMITTSIGVLTEQSLYDAPFSEAGMREEIRDYYGGSLKSILRKVKQGAKKIAPVIETVSGMLAPALAAKNPSYGKVAELVSEGAKLARGGARARGQSLSRRM
jgi:hypothetical protein